MSNKGKRSKTLSEVKAIENISKNLKSFLGVSPYFTKNATKCILVLKFFWIIKGRSRKINPRREIARIN